MVNVNPVSGFAKASNSFGVMWEKFRPPVLVGVDESVAAASEIKAKRTYFIFIFQLNYIDDLYFIFD